MSIAKCASWPPESGQTSPTITTTEVVAKTAAFGGSGGAQGGSIREHRRVLCRGSRRSQYQLLLGPRGSLEPQGSDRAGLLAPTGGTVGRSTLGWAIGDAGDFTSEGTLCTSEPTFVRARTCSRVYSTAVYGASQPYI